MKCNACGHEVIWQGRNNKTQEDIFLCHKCNIPSTCQHQFMVINQKVRDNEQTGICINCKEPIAIFKAG